MKNGTGKILRIFNSGVLCLALLFALMGMSNNANLEGVKGSAYYGLTFLALAAYELISFFYQRKTAPKKSDFFRLGYCAVCFVTAISAFIIPATNRLYALPALLYLIVPVAKRIVTIISKRKARTIIYNCLIIITCVLAFLATFALLWVVKDGLYGSAPLFVYMIIVLTCLTNICTMVFSQFNREILLNIVHKTYAGEIIVGLFLLVVAFSLVLMHNEESIHSFGDALWYCFSIITTIGFGDIAAVSLVGRILTVILGIYGIVVVSILTSIIVNFYSEVKDKKTDDDLEEDEPENNNDKEEPNDEPVTSDAQDEKQD